MSSVNKVILVGNLGMNPESKSLPSGGLVTSIRIATSEFRRNKETGLNNEHTEWHRVVFFDKLAGLAAKYLTKGSQVYVEGKLRTRKWQAQDGTDKYMTEVVADEMQFMGRSNSSKFEPEPVKPTTMDTYHKFDPYDDESIPF